MGADWLGSHVSQGVAGLVWSCLGEKERVLMFRSCSRAKRLNKKKKKKRRKGGLHGVCTEK